MNAVEEAALPPLLIEIPAFAGMVYLCTGNLWADVAIRRRTMLAAGDNNVKSVRNSPSATRPFLRRQESHSVVRRLIPYFCAIPLNIGGRQQC